jgi:nitrite reductase/ring-hydroxylating ferredoxin subunit
MSWRSHPQAPAPGSVLCRLDAIASGECHELRFGEILDGLSLVLMRDRDRVWAYVNRCPHFSLPLNSRPGEFLVTEPRHVMCAWHCAVFRFEDGHCIEGPAQGRSLESVPIEIIDGEVRVASA